VHSRLHLHALHRVTSPPFLSSSGADDAGLQT